MQDNKIHIDPKFAAEGGWLSSPGGSLDLDAADVVLAVVTDGSGGLILADGSGAIMGSANIGEHQGLSDWISQHLDAVSRLGD